MTDISCIYCHSKDISAVDISDESDQTGHYVVCSDCEASGPMAASADEAWELYSSLFMRIASLEAIARKLGDLLPYFKGKGDEDVMHIGVDHAFIRIAYNLASHYPETKAAGSAN